MVTLPEERIIRKIKRSDGTPEIIYMLPRYVATKDGIVDPWYEGIPINDEQMVCPPTFLEA